MLKAVVSAALLTAAALLPALPARAAEPVPECRCESGLSERPAAWAEDLDYSKAFKEGSPNLTSPHSVAADSLRLLYSHNFFWSSVPRNSRPAFWFKYSPFERLQLDLLTTLRSPFELELGLSYQIFDEFAGDALSLSPRLSFNTRGNLVGAELSASRFILPEIWQVGADLRFLSTGAPEGFDRPIAAAGFNTLLRVWKHWHLFADLAVPFDGEALQRQLIWSAGLKKRIPHTPHVLTLYVGNSQEQSLSGRTLSLAGDLPDLLGVGFLFSIEIESLSQLPARLF